jgi:hypothetical protein
MSLDELVLTLQRLVDRVVRRSRLGPAPAPGGPRVLIVQIDGLPRAVLEEALARGFMPFLQRLLGHGHRLHPMSVGLPTSTPAFQIGAMYGVRPDIPGFHYHDKRRRADIHFPRGGDAAWVEETQAKGRRGILEGGSAYGCVFTGGAANNLFTFATLKRPTGAGLLRAVSSFLVLGWVLVKCLVLSAVDLLRAVLRFVADPVGESARGWKSLAIKIGVSVWLRQLFTLSVSRDVYRGVPAIYVNYLDYDVFAHAFGPRHRRALRALRRVDRSLHQIWRVARRVTEHRYELYVLSDHGQVTCRPYVDLHGGRPIERVLLDEFFDRGGDAACGPGDASACRAAFDLRAWNRQQAPGALQRFLNYLEDDLPWLRRDLPEARERNGVRVIGAGPNAFVYFLREAEPVTLEWIDRQWPGLADDVSCSRGIGFVLARSEAGPVCIVQGKRSRLGPSEPGPFAGPREALVLHDIADLMAMRSAGDLVLYGHDAPDGNISYVHEVGAHAGPAEEEMETFIVTPPGLEIGAPITHPTQLYPLFMRPRDA